MKKIKNSEIKGEVRYFQVNLPAEVVDEFDKSQRKLGLSKQRVSTLALHAFNKMSLKDKLDIYAEILGWFDDDDD